MELLSVTERRNVIVEILNDKGKVSVNELSERFGVSGVVIRTDLSELEKKGLLTRIHGGAITSYKAYYDMSLVQRSNTNAHEKKAIGKAVHDMIKDNDTIMMNAGTTPLFIMREIMDKKVTIVTNSIALALEGARNPNFSIILLGGDVDSNYQFTYGVSAIKSMEPYTADLLIMSVDGIEPAKGISTFYHQEAEICRYMIKHARRTAVVADFSKIGRTAFAEIDGVDKIDTLVTSEGADPACLSSLKNRNIEIIIAKDNA
ncbi:MAG: DeoR/GlpR transcriptional regulator [Clostridia bacterium]|nr:DeoR/GlpR transcriptional regulator [Clostridia bacterium]